MSNSRRDTLLLIGMWAGAFVAVAGLMYSRRDATTFPPGAAGTVDSAPADGSSAHGAQGGPDPAELTEGARGASVAERAASNAGMQTMYRGGPRHQAQSGAVGPTEPVEVFNVELGGMIKAQAVVGANGQIYVASLGSAGHGLGEAPGPGSLHVLSASGETVWSRELEGDVYSTPLVTARGRVYVGSDAGYFWGLAADGTVRWRVRTEGDADTGAVLVRGVLYFGAGDEVWAVREDGSVLWRFEAGSKVFTSPAAWRGETAAETTIYAGSQDDHLYALAADGTTRWSAAVGGDIDSSPVIGDDGSVYFGSDDGHVYAYTAAGRRRFATDLDGYVRAPLALSAGGVLLAGVMGPTPRVVALDAQSGELRWTFRLPVTDSRELGVLSGPLLDANDAVYFGGHDDYIYALSPMGELRWAHPVSGDIDAPPTLGPDGVLYVGSDDSHLYAIGQR